MKLETDYGTFEADTEQELLRAAAKSKREARAQEKLDAQNREAAYSRARENGYRVLLRVLEDKGNRFGLLRRGERFGAPVEVTGERSERVTLETYHGRAVLELYGWRYVAHVWDAGGFAIAVFLQDRDGAQEFQASAIGVCEGQVALTPLPFHVVNPSCFKLEAQS